MPVVEVFPRAPIVEAILSLEVNYLDNLFFSADNFWEAVRKALPIRKVIEQAGTVRSSAGLQSQAGGYRFESEDGLHIVQITRRTFSFHRMRPYQDWDRFSITARDFWAVFVTHFGPERVSEIHLRYLNRIAIPLPIAALQDYLCLYPRVPQGIDTGSSGYLMRLSLADLSVPALAYVTQRSEHDPEGATFPVVFDIDVRREGEIDISDEGLWHRIESLRDYKNRLFFESITEQTRALFR